MPFKKGEIPKNAKVFKKGQSGNPKGRPLKVVGSVSRELIKLGYERASASQIVECFELLINLDEEKIKELIADPKNPMLLRITGKDMLSPRGRDVIEKLLDRAHGKPKQISDVNLKGDIDFNNSTVSFK